MLAKKLLWFTFDLLIKLNLRPKTVNLLKESTSSTISVFGWFAWFGDLGYQTACGQILELSEVNYTQNSLFLQKILSIHLLNLMRRISRFEMSRLLSSPPFLRHDSITCSLYPITLSTQFSTLHVRLRLKRVKALRPKRLSSTSYDFLDGSRTDEFLDFE